jgi:hypothetical protein
MTRQFLEPLFLVVSTRERRHEGNQVVDISFRETRDSRFTGPSADISVWMAAASIALTLWELTSFSALTAPTQRCGE